MKAPRFSVIIPTLNEEKFLPNLLTSLVSQSVKDFEVIVVDGKSKDKTVIVARTFGKKIPKLHVIVSPKASLPLQRNIGASAAQSEWLVFVDADSVLHTNFIQRIGEYVVKKSPKFFTTWLKTDSKDLVGRIVGFLFNISIEWSLLIGRPWSPGPLTIVRKDIFESVHGYNEKVTYAEDHDFSMKLHTNKIPFRIFREILYVYSLRRFRNEGILKAVARNSWSMISVVVKKKVPTEAPGFIMGGSLYATDTHNEKLRFFSKRSKKSSRLI